MDELATRYFNSPERYAKAIQLLARYEEVENLQWGKVEAYLSELNEAENLLLEKAIDHRNAQKTRHRNPSEQIQELERKLDQLLSVLDEKGATAFSKLIPDSPSAGKKNSTTVDSLAETPLPTSISDEDLLLTEAIQRFIAFKEKSVTKGTLTSIRSKLDVLDKVLSEHQGQTPRISQLTPPRIRYFRDTLVQLPSKRGGLPKDLTVKTMLKMKLPTISQKTAKDTTVLIGEFIRWMEAESYPVQDKLIGVLSLVKSPKKKEQKQRINYSVEELRRLFETDHYSKGLWKRGSDYWIPLIALFTGARLGEITQLHCSDLYETEGT